MKNVNIPNPVITMMPNTKGLNLSVSADALCTLKAVGETYGIYFDSKGCHYDRRVIIDEVHEQKLLIEQEDISRHGSPCWEDVRTISDDPKRIAAVQAFDNLLEALSKLGD